VTGLFAPVGQASGSHKTDHGRSSGIGHSKSTNPFSRNGLGHLRTPAAADDAVVLRDFGKVPEDMLKELKGAYKGLEKLANTGAGGSAENESSASMSGDQFTSGYIYFIASQDPEVQSGDKDISEKVAEVGQSISQATSPGESAVAEVTAYGAISASESLSVYFQSDGLNEELYMQASATMQATLAGEVTLADGTKVSFQAEVNVSVSVQAAMQRGQSQPQQQSDPLALDIDGDGQISLSDTAGGTAFDINADGQVDQTAFVTGNDVFLAMDRNGSGKIDDGSELFGDQHGAANGYLELAQFDQNGDGVIDQQDPVFNSLRGVSLGTDGVIHESSLGELGVSAILLKYQNVDQAASGGNHVTQVGSYTSTNGAQQATADVMLNYQRIETEG
jgi:hypothetical protein